MEHLRTITSSPSIISSSSSAYFKSGRSAALKANSTTTIFKSNTLSDPDNDSVILSMSMILQLQCIQDIENYDYSKQKKYNIFNDQILVLDKNMTDNDVYEFIKSKGIPLLEEIYTFIKSVYDCSQYSSECNIISLIYINTILHFGEINLTYYNWKSLILLAIIIAQVLYLLIL